MVAVGLRVLAATATAGVLATMATPAAAGTALPVTLSPTFGPVGTVLDVAATSGLTDVTSVTFGSGATAQRDSADTSAPSVDTDVHVTVPAGAKSGVLTLTYADNHTTQTDKSYVVQAVTHATISRSRAVVQFPHGATVRATLTAAGHPVSGQPAHLQRAAPGSNAWRQVYGVQTTSSTGAVHWHVGPHRVSTYRVVFSSVPAFLGDTTGRVRIGVRPLVTVHAPSIAPILTNESVRGRVRPAPAHHGSVRLDERVGGVWHHVDTVATHRHGHYRFHVSMPSTGRYAFRVRRVADAGHRAGRSTVAPVKAVQRSLHSGMSGPDVLTLQKRLKHLHYDLGHADGNYGFDTVHAVVAFEKVQGLTRDGAVGLQVWKALADPRRMHLHYRSDASTAGVEVNLHRQVLLYAVRGHIVRILDASTGGGYYYTGSDGTQQRAITPRGHFGIVYQRNGWVTSPLGTLYRPAYFNYDGYAIHGETEVPSYPASHGCVRITVPARDRLGGKLYNGLSVWIY